MFEAVNYLLHEKNKTELDADLIQEFNPHITTKTFSFYDSGKYCNYINDTLNVYSNLFKEKDEQFKFFDSIIPKLKRRKSEYIKRKYKEEEKPEIQHIPEFMSKRELEYYEQGRN